MRLLERGLSSADKGEIQLNTSEIEQSLGTGLYASREITLVKGVGATVWDEYGKEYIDCTAGVGVANIGHSHPALVEAILQPGGKS